MASVLFCFVLSTSKLNLDDFNVSTAERTVSGKDDDRNDDRNQKDEQDD